MINITKSGYTHYELKCELNKVFQTVWFDDLTLKFYTQNSYFDNFSTLIDYASAHNIDEKEYIRSIRECLLQMKNTHER